MYTLVIDHGRASHVTTHPDRADGRTGFLRYLDTEGLDYQLAQASPERTTYTLTAVADLADPDGARVVREAILERMTGAAAP